MDDWISEGAKDRDVLDMERYVLYWREWLAGASSERREIFKKYVEALISLGHPLGLEVKGYGCYGGNEVWPCDWQASAACLTELLKHPGKDFAANSLGYIYYYGRLHDGQPDYEKAFAYFTRAAAAGLYEARYKLADMYKNGYFVPKDWTTAYDMTWAVYLETKEEFMQGDDMVPFADAALRMGVFMLEDEQIDAAQAYLLEADFAIRRRMMRGDFFGDTKVFSRIQSLLKEAHYDESRLQKRARWGLLTPFAMFLRDTPYDRYRMEVKETKKGIFLTLTRCRRKREGRARETLFTVPEIGYCEKTSRITLLAKKAKIGKRPRKSSFLVDEWELPYKRKKLMDTFYYNGKKVFSISAKDYEMKAPPEKVRAVKPGKVYTFASIIFREGGDSYDYICDIPDVAVGDTVLVPSYDGPALVKVVRVFKVNIDKMQLPYTRYKKVLGK